MKKVYQEIVDKGKGDCMRATVASIFEKDLHEVPNFIEFGDEWYEHLANYYKDQGYKDWPTCINRKEVGPQDTHYLQLVAKWWGGHNGYLFGSVPSQTFKNGTTHAVVVDTDLNIVHDPNPNQMALELGPDDVIDILVPLDFICGRTGRIYSSEEYDKLPDEIQEWEVYGEDSRKEWTIPYDFFNEQDILDMLDVALLVGHQSKGGQMGAMYSLFEMKLCNVWGKPHSNAPSWVRDHYKKRLKRKKTFSYVCIKSNIADNIILKGTLSQLT